VRNYGSIDVAQLFRSMQEQMAARFETTRRSVPHDPTKGQAAEQNWLALLNGYLPERYRADSAFVVDHRGELSEQIDVVIYDRQYSPLIFHQDNVLYVPAESVYAVFDSKHQMTSESVKQAAEKAESVRRLKRTSAAIRHAGGTYKPRPLFEIIAGILSLEAWWADGVGESLAKLLNELSTAGMLDLGCAVRTGAFESRLMKRRIEVQVSTRENALIFFFVRLLQRLQRVGTAPAIDLDRYVETMETRTVAATGEVKYRRKGKRELRAKGGAGE
jgi:hypothetical protein